METGIDRFHTNAAQRHIPQAVLVFPILLKRLVWVRHPLRGWEVPGGKIEPGETPEAAACRETYEEAGAVIENLEWLAEYRVKQDGRVKWVFKANVVDLGAKPEHSETLDVGMLNPAWKPAELCRLPGVSYVMKDDMYQQLWPMLSVEALAHGR